MQPKKSGHAVTRYAVAHALDPLAAALRMDEELAAARAVDDEEEARQIVGRRVLLAPGCTYLAGEAGLFVIDGGAVSTYLYDGSLRHFKHRECYGRKNRTRRRR